MAVLRPELPHASYTSLRNCWLRDDRISLKAKGLLGYLLSHTIGYKCSQAQMVRDSADGKEAMRSALAELEANGYLTRIPQRSAGRFAEDDYVLTDPFDADGRITRLSAAGDRRETRQSGFSDADKPTRETRPLEDQGLEHQESPSDSPSLFAVADNGHRSKDTLAAAFDTFWASYPRKVGKDAARRAWTSAARRADPDEIITAVKQYPFSADPQYIPHPTTWLNQGRWADDPAAVKPAGAVGTSRYGPAYRNPDPSTPNAFPERF